MLGIPDPGCRADPFDEGEIAAPGDARFFLTRSSGRVSRPRIFDIIAERRSGVTTSKSRASKIVFNLSEYLSQAFGALVFNVEARFPDAPGNLCCRCRDRIAVQTCAARGCLRLSVIRQLSNHRESYAERKRLRGEEVPDDAVRQLIGTIWMPMRPPTRGSRCSQIRWPGGRVARLSSPEYGPGDCRSWEGRRRGRLATTRK